MFIFAPMKTISKETDPRYLACPIRQVITRFGDKWTLLVLGILGSSDQKKMRYSEIHEKMLDCSQKMLSQTLKNLESNKLINRKVYPEVPPRVEYSLTELGISLLGPLKVLVEWAQENMNKIIKD